MVNGKSLLVNNIFILFVIIFITSYYKKNTNHKIEEVDNLISISSVSFKNGDLIYRNGNGAISQFFKKTSRHEQLYSHGGIISISNDSVYVIHAEASEITRIGGAKKEYINSFLKGITQWGVYRIDTTQNVRDKIAICAIEYVKKETPFDFDFDITADDEIYCTQLLSLSINKVMGREVIQAKESPLLNKKYYAVDDTYLMPRAKLVFKQVD